MRLFYFVIDAAAYNAFILWDNTSSMQSNRQDKRRLFLIEAADLMIRPFIEKRAAIPRIANQPSVARALCSVGATIATDFEPKNSQKRGRCQSCARNKDHNIENRCELCKKFVCGSHSVKKVTYRSITCPLQD